MKSKLLLIVLGVLLISGPGFAQQKLILDLNAAREHALEHNKNMINTGYALDKAQLAVKEAIANGLPQVEGSVDYSNALGANISIRFQEDMPATEIAIKPTSNFYLTVNQLLFSGNYIVGVQIAKLSKELTRMSQQKTELEVLTNVTDAYYMVLISKETESIIGQNVENLQDLYQKTEMLVKAGVIEQTDLDQLFVQLKSLENTLSSAQRQTELAINLLRLQLGAGIDTEIELTETLDGLIEQADLENVLLGQFDLQKNVDFQLMEQQEMLSEKMINMQKSNALPMLAAFYRYTYKILKPDFDTSPKNIVGLQMNIPIFSSGLRSSKTRQAMIDLKTTQNNKSMLEDQLLTMDKQLRFNFNNAVEAFTNQKTNVEVSRRVYANLKLKYEQGLISGLDLINADNNYLRAESDYISAMMQVLNSRLQLEKLYGNIQ
ncbi:MAG: TolC family protein [Sphingobacteriia bacterium]|nr:TolC family protein [Sphingobacteriia bacterium]